MKYLLLTLLGFYNLSCAQTPSNQTVSHQMLVDTSIVAIIPYDSTERWAFEKGKHAELIVSDISKIERLLKICINKYNISQQKRYEKVKADYPKLQLRKENYIIDLKRYKRQYVVIINSKGEKEVWVNCFCDTFDEKWKKDIVIFLDGGNCYFNLKINLTKETYYDLMVNGDA